jgi:ribonuclease HI
VVIVTPDGHVTELGGGASLTTNNKMELTGAIEALSRLQGTSGPVSIYTDSTYVIQGITGWVHGWKRRGWKTAGGTDVLNRGLWERLDALVSARGPRALSWHYVRGHVGIPGNERVDEIADSFAVAAARRAVRWPARWLPGGHPRSARRHDRAAAQLVVQGRERVQGARLLVPQRRRWQADAPRDLARVRAAREGPLRRAVQEGRERAEQEAILRSWRFGPDDV